MARNKIVAIFLVFAMCVVTALCYAVMRLHVVCPSVCPYVCLWRSGTVIA